MTWGNTKLDINNIITIRNRKSLFPSQGICIPAWCGASSGRIFFVRGVEQLPEFRLSNLCRGSTASTGKEHSMSLLKTYARANSEKVRSVLKTGGWQFTYWDITLHVTILLYQHVPVKMLPTGKVRIRPGRNAKSTAVQPRSLTSLNLPEVSE